MTKEEFFAKVRKNAECNETPICKNIQCKECPFDTYDCTEEAVYYLLKAFDELKEKYGEVIYNGNNEDV